MCPLSDVLKLFIVQKPYQDMFAVKCDAVVCGVMNRIWLAVFWDAALHGLLCTGASYSGGPGFQFRPRDCIS
jgi:hypothetical protein